MIETGDTGVGPEVRAEGAEPRNVFLADFDAAGGCDALVRLTQNQRVLVSAWSKARQLHWLLAKTLGVLTNA